MLLASVAFYLTLTIAIGYWASRKVKNVGDFMLAGRSLPLALSSAAMFAIWFGSETVFGASAEFLKGGLYAVIEDPFGGALCLILFGMFFARKLYSMKLLTLGDFFEQRYGKRTELVASFFLAPPYVGYIAAQLVAMGLILNIIIGIPVWQGVILAATVVTFYTFIGGMWAISITDFFQSIIIILGLVILAITLSQKAGGVATIINEVPQGTFRFLPKPEFKEMMIYISAWSVLGLGSLPSQDVFQRVMSSSNAKVAVRSCFIAAALYLTVAMLPLFISLCVKKLYPEFSKGDTQLALPRMVLTHTNIFVQILFFGSLLSAIMSTTSSAILAPSAIFSENLIRPLSKGKLSDKQLLLVTRLCVLGFATVATVMACLRSNIYHLVGESSILSLVSLFAPLTLGLYWKKANSTGALLSMILGITTWLFFEFYETGYPSLLPATLVSFLALICGSLWSYKNTSMTKIELTRVDGDYNLEAVNDSGNKILLDGSPEIGGHNNGMRPMQTLLAAMGGCSAIDVISILRKQREDLKDIKITVTGEREKDKTPSLYTDVHAHFKLFGNIDADKAQKAVSLSMEKYCSVAKTLEKSAKITYSFEIINQ